MKKRTSAALLLILCLLLAAAAGCSGKPSETSSGPSGQSGAPTYTEVIKNNDIVGTDGNVLVKCTLTYPEFDSDVLNGIVAAYVRSFSDAAAGSAADAAANDLYVFEYTYTCKVLACTAKMVSLRIEEYVFMGGPHGSTNFYGLVLEPETGASISPAQLLGMSDADAMAAVRQAFLDLIATDTEQKYFYPDAAELLDGILGKGMPTCYVESGMAVFVIQTYDIASYAAGPQSVALPLGGAFAG